MKQKIFFDLTPLLDIVLILLFAFMLNVNAGSTEKENMLHDEQQLNNKLVDTIKSKDNEISNLKEEIGTLNKKIDEMSFDISNEKESLINISTNLARWFNTNKDMLNQISTNKNIEKLADKDSILEQLHKYEAISKKYFFVDIVLKSTQNKLFINGEDTNTFISLDEVISPESRKNKKEQIKDIIENVIDNKEGGYTFVLITLKEEDHVYRYAFTVVWDAIKEIQQKHGTDKIFKTKYVLPD
jgi:biopolymer transport protein ExbD